VIIDLGVPQKTAAGKDTIEKKPKRPAFGDRIEMVSRATCRTQTLTLLVGWSLSPSRRHSMADVRQLGHYHADHVAGFIDQRATTIALLDRRG